MIDTNYNRHFGKATHDNVLKSKQHIDDIGYGVQEPPPRARGKSVKEQTEVFRKYKKQVPVIGGNGLPNVEMVDNLGSAFGDNNNAMEDEISGKASLKRQIIGGANSSNVSFAPTLKKVEGYKRETETKQGLKPSKPTKKLIEGSVPIATSQLLASKLPTIQTAPPAMSGGASKAQRGKAKAVKADPVSAPTKMSWNELIKDTCSKHKCNLSHAIKYIKENNLYSKQ
jgi:hypothetical protein